MSSITTTLSLTSILYEDHHLVIVNKPAPLLTQAPTHIPSLEAMVKQYIKEKYSKPAGVYLAVPHRLDRPVTGAICFARNTKAAQRIQLQFEARTVRKTYWALIAGNLHPDTGEWIDWIRKLPNEAKAAKAVPDEPGAKRAVLEYRVLERLPNSTLVEFAPQTGRMHQLRVQSAWRGHPILGDSTYAESPPFGASTENPFEQQIALHARCLVLKHPFQEKSLEIQASLPNHWPLDELRELGRIDERTESASSFSPLVHEQRDNEKV
jgi:23S rRNA pseudouridine1911/1915/1917 synthase